MLQLVKKKRRVSIHHHHSFTFKKNITKGGSLCIQDLTLSGWNIENDIETFIIMIRNLILEGK
jgi:hypothetical protein